MRKVTHWFSAILFLFIFLLTADGIFAQNRIRKNIRQYGPPDAWTIISEPAVNSQFSTVVAPLPNKLSANNTVTVIPLGTSANGLGWGYAGGQRTHLWADDNLKTVALIHRMGPGSIPSNLSGYLAVDKAVNMGQTQSDWTLNWQIYASNILKTGNYIDLALYPQLGILNPAGNSNPDDSYIHYFAPLVTNVNYFGNYTHGRARWGSQSDSTKDFNWFTPPPYHNTPDGFFISQANKAYVVDLDYNSTTGVYNNNLVVGVGTWNNTTRDFEYTYSSLPLNTSVFQTIPLSPRIAADPSGQHVWIACIGNNGEATPVFDSTYYPVFFHSSDGGQTWSQPYAVAIDGMYGFSAVLNFISDYRLYLQFYPNPVPPRDEIAYSTAFDCDLVVDNWGVPHFGVGVHLAGLTGFSVTAADSLFAIFHIYSVDLGYTWCARAVGWPKQFRGYFPASQGIAEDNRVNVSINKDGDHVFFTWLDSQSPTDTANDHPDVFARGINLLNCKYTSSSGIDQGTNITNSSSVSNSAWFADASYYVFTKPDNSYIIPIASEAITGGNIVSNPVGFNYIPDFSFSPDDFTIDAQDPAWGDDCLWSGCNYWGIKENVFTYSSILATANPNPAKDIVNLILNLPETGFITLDFYSLLGQRELHKEYSFLESGEHTVKLDVSNLIPGIYFYTVSLGAQRVSGKLIVE
ncbi:MAG: T9SS type A sorting domain-containing protein [Bacteroidetes bacterium]|nr:T9SS type A sorting domain-containing protein [Bacteroidota bacterium]